MAQVFRRACGRRTPKGFLAILLVLAGAAEARTPEVVIELRLPAGAAAAEWRANAGIYPARDLALAAFVAAEPAVAGVEVGAGAFPIPLPAAGSWRLEVNAPGRIGAAALLAGIAETAALPPLELVSAQSARLVIEKEGRPWPGVLVLAQPAGELYEEPWRPATLRLVADDRGQVAIPAGVPCDVLIASAEGPLWRGRVALEPGAAQRLELPDARSFVLTAVDGTGRPVAGARVSVAGLLVDGVTSAEGRLAFAAGGAAKEVPAIRVLASGGSWASRAAEPIAGEQKPAGALPAELRVVLAPPQRLPVKVLDRGSLRPIAGALVWPGAHPEILARTGAGGEAELVLPWGGASLVNAAAPAYRPLVAESREAGRLLLEPAPPRLALRGRVEDAAGRPIAGAAVKLRPSGERSRDEKKAGEIPPVVSDARGELFFAAVAAAAIDLEVAAAGFAPALVRGIAVVPPSRAGEPADLGTLVLEPAVAIAGRVIKPDGEPLAGAKVAAREPRGRNRAETAAGPDGSFRLEGFAAGASIEIGAEHPDAQAGSLVVPAGESPEVLLVLQPASRVAGRVRSDGEPAAGVVVLLRSGGVTRGSTRTDEGGRFELRGVAPGLLDLETVSRGLFGEALRFELAAGESIEDLELELSPGAIVEGRVLSEDGTPLDKVVVEVIGIEGDLRSRLAGLRAFTDEEGAYRLEGLAPGKAALRARRIDLPAAEQRLEVVAGSQELDWRLSAGLRASGSIVDDQGQPVAGARISAFDEGGRVVVDSSRSDAEGRFLLEGLTAGPLRVAGESGDRPRAETTVFLAAGIEPPEVRLVCPPAASLEGRLLGASFEELSRAKVWARSSGGLQRDGQVAYDGSYRIGRLTAGEWRVFARAPGFPREAAGRALLREGERGSLDLELSRDGYRLTGVVRRAGAPLAGIRVSAGSESGSGGGARTDEGGSFAIEALPAGAYRVTLLGDGIDQNRLITLDGNLDLTFELDAAPPPAPFPPPSTEAKP